MPDKEMIALVLLIGLAELRHGNTMFQLNLQAQALEALLVGNV